MIEDNGPGISEEVMEHLYEPFNTDKTKGVGLGLTAVQNTVSAHGGDIRVESNAENRTRFYITLPVGTTEAG